ncbi:protein TonB [Sphaerotilus hippei]|uniref:Protein TonB n=1 Tax=Sphaerotilus hippei TaxID=744406 RepID=A0A318H9X6_9BURK|nr:energy transducer TonB [Sphaerotilus hippei]PXW95250.1 protein TonB [Sphaerotilus hippei]
MALDYRPRVNTPGRWAGIAAVLLLHALVLWALVSGLARQVVERVREPIEMAIITERREPPPPPPPPPPELKPPTPPREVRVTERAPVPPPAPLPPVVPPPDVRPPAAPAPVVQAIVQERAPERAPERPAESRPAVAPVPAPAPAPAVSRQEVALVCPGYKDILQSALAGVVDRVGIDGDVTVQLVVRGQEVVDVKALSGPREYFRPVVGAVRRFRCSAGAGDAQVTTTLTVGFKLE